MLQIINKIPIFVWPLFFVLLLGGLKARKTSQVPLFLLLLIPSIFFIWSSFSFFSQYGSSVFLDLVWLLCLGSGFFIGFLHMQKIHLQFDKRKVEMPGSLIPLILSMSIFTSKFSIGMISSTLPQLKGSTLLLGLELFAVIILGVFWGRGIGCLWRYKKSSYDKNTKIFPDKNL